MYSKPSEIIADLGRESSRLKKEDILKYIMGDLDNDAHRIVCAGFQRALDTYETFGVKVVPHSHHDNSMELSTEWKQVRELMNNLALRKLTGNAARDAIESMSLKVDATEWNEFYSKVLLKDLKCGVNIATWNKIAKKFAPEYAVSVFSCQLAHDGAKEKAITGEKLVEVKLDGVRVIAIVHPNGRVDLHSRNGKRLTNFPKIEQALSKYAIETPFVLDGEVMSSSFQDLMKQVYRKEDVQTDDACLYLFDIVSYRSFKEGKDSAPQRVRSEILKNTIQPEDCIQVVNQSLIDLDTELGQSHFNAINRKAIENGYEGIMIKDPEAPYETKRTKSWLKIKPVIEVTLEVVNVEEGSGKFEGTTGALVCRGQDSGKDISVNVGSGLADSDRDSIWANRTSVVGQLVEIKADAITQNQDGTYSLRFPRFKTFRGFEPGEKL